MTGWLIIDHFCEPWNQILARPVVVGGGNEADTPLRQIGLARIISTISSLSRFTRNFRRERLSDRDYSDEIYILKCSKLLSILS